MHKSSFSLVSRLSVIGIAILANPAGARADTVFTIDSVSASWGPNFNTWNFDGPGIEFSGMGRSDPAAFLFFVPGNILQPFAGGFSGYTAEYIGTTAVNTGFITLDGTTYRATGVPLAEPCRVGPFDCAAISGSGSVSAAFTVPVGPAVIQVSAVMSGGGSATSCWGTTPTQIPPGICPASPPGGTFAFSIPGNLTITVGAPDLENNQYVEAFTATFSGSAPALPEPGSTVLAGMGLALTCVLRRRPRIFVFLGRFIEAGGKRYTGRRRSTCKRLANRLRGKQRPDLLT